MSEHGKNGNGGTGDQTKAPDQIGRDIKFEIGEEVEFERTYKRVWEINEVNTKNMRYTLIPSTNPARREIHENRSTIFLTKEEMIEAGVKPAGPTQEEKNKAHEAEVSAMVNRLINSGAASFEMAPPEDPPEAPDEEELQEPAPEEDEEKLEVTEIPEEEMINKSITPLSGTFGNVYPDDLEEVINPEGTLNDDSESLFDGDVNDEEEDDDEEEGNFDDFDMGKEEGEQEEEPPPLDPEPESTPPRTRLDDEVEFWGNYLPPDQRVTAVDDPVEDKRESEETTPANFPQKKSRIKKKDPIAWVIGQSERIIFALPMTFFWSLILAKWFSGGWFALFLLVSFIVSCFILWLATKTREGKEHIPSGMETWLVFLVGIILFSGAKMIEVEQLLFWGIPIALILACWTKYLYLPATVMPWGVILISAGLADWCIWFMWIALGLLIIHLLIYLISWIKKK